MARKTPAKLKPDINGVAPGSPDDYLFESYANIPAEDPSWLWPGVIPTSALTLLEGDPSTGKSTLVMDILNSAVRGLPLPDGSVCPLKGVEAIYQCTEVGKPGIVSKILGNSGTLKDAIHIIRGENLTLSDVRIQRGLREGNVRVLVIDPMQQYFEGNMNNASSVRKKQSALSAFAVENDAAVILICHFGKEKKRVGISTADVIVLNSAEIDHVPLRGLSPVLRPDRLPSLPAFPTQLHHVAG